MEKVDLFSKELECLYKEEKYSVRDNGAVMRHSREGMRIRKDDNIWSFGKLNTQNGFLMVGGNRTHQIVATAFLGNAPTKQHVVVHIDTDKRNNRPENLYWVTKFENTILTPYNCEKIKELCDNSIENILKNIDIVKDIDLTLKFSWIQKIDQNEASKAFSRLIEISKIVNLDEFNSLDDWLDYRYELHNRVFNDSSDKKTYIKQSLNKNAIQIKWAVPSEFPCCPTGIVENPIIAYFNNLKLGCCFCKNDFYQRNIYDFSLSEDEKSLFVASESIEGKNAVKPWALAKITYKDSVYAHHSLGSFFTQEGVEKYFCLAQGKEWNRGDCFDDYCL